MSGFFSVCPATFAQFREKTQQHVVVCSKAAIRLIRLIRLCHVPPKKLILTQRNVAAFIDPAIKQLRSFFSLKYDFFLL